MADELADATDATAHLVVAESEVDSTLVETEASPDAAKKIGQPRGRPPRDHTWDAELSCWVDASGTPRVAKSQSPRQPKQPMVTVEATTVDESAVVSPGAGTSVGYAMVTQVIIDPNAPAKKKRGRPLVRCQPACQRRGARTH